VVLVHRRATEGTEGLSFFAHRETTMGKNHLPLRGKGGRLCSACGGLMLFICRRLPANEKITSPRTLRLCGEYIVANDCKFSSLY